MNSSDNEFYPALVVGRGNQDRAARDFEQGGSNMHASAPSSLAGFKPHYLVSETFE